MRATSVSSWPWNSSGAISSYAASSIHVALNDSTIGYSAKITNALIGVYFPVNNPANSSSYTSSTAFGFAALPSLGEMGCTVCTLTEGSAFTNRLSFTGSIWTRSRLSSGTLAAISDAYLNPVALGMSGTSPLRTGVSTSMAYYEVLNVDPTNITVSYYSDSNGNLVVR